MSLLDLRLLENEVEDINNTLNETSTTDDNIKQAINSTIQDVSNRAKGYPLTDDGYKKEFIINSKNYKDKKDKGIKFVEKKYSKYHVRYEYDNDELISIIIFFKFKDKNGNMGDGWNTGSVILDKSVLNETSDNDDIVSDTKIEDPQQTQVQNNTDKVFIFNPDADINIIEDSIKEKESNLDECIAESIYNVDKILYDAMYLIENIEISTLNKQYKILQESTIGSDKYKEDIDTLIEASGTNILTVIIDKIKKFIEAAKNFLAKIGITIGIHLVDYDKFVEENRESLLSLSNKIGNKVVIKDFIKYDKDIVFDTVNFKQLHSIADNYIEQTSSKDNMKDIITKIRNKYNSDADFYNDIYAHVLAASVGIDNNTVITDKDAALKSYLKKFIVKEKDITMDTEHTSKMLEELKNAKSETSSIISSMKNGVVNDLEFNRLTKEIQSAMLKSEEEEKVTKYAYYKLRFGALSAVQTACNDIYRTKITFIKKYYRGIYDALKKLHSENIKDNMNESVDEKSILDKIPALVLQS